MKKILSILALSALAVTTAFAQNAPDLNSSNPNAKKFWVRGWASSGGGGSNLVYHTGGSVLANAKVVLIFWGPSFAAIDPITGKIGADNAYATELQAYRNQFGGTGEYNTITQYYGQDPGPGTINIQSGSLVNQPDWFDSSTPPQNVTDAAVQGEVQKYIRNNNGGATDYEAVYEVFLPSTSFSSDGSQASCGATSGFTLAYCAYHSHYVDGAGKNVKYSIEPWPGCGGCQVSGWTAVKNQEHFVSHETREAVTDPLGNAWFDRRGYEADDKCAWSPTPFLDPTTGYGYQYEWSNANGGCVKTR